MYRFHTDFLQSKYSKNSILEEFKQTLQTFLHQYVSILPVEDNKVTYTYVKKRTLHKRPTLQSKLFGLYFTNGIRLNSWFKLDLSWI